MNEWMNECFKASYILFFLNDALQVKFPPSDSADYSKPKSLPLCTSNAVTVSVIQLRIL